MIIIYIPPPVFGAEGQILINVHELITNGQIDSIYEREYDGHSMQIRPSIQSH